MDFGLTDEQRALDASVREFLADRFDLAAVRSVFDDPLLAKHYWPTERYENLHRFDVDARWTVREERVRAGSLPLTFSFL